MHDVYQEPERALWSAESEHGVIGALLHKPDLAEAIGSFLLPAHFHYADNAKLYTMILSERSRGRNPDPITLSNYAPTLPSGTSTLAYAAELQMNVVGAANAKQYAKVVFDRWQARKLHQTAMDICYLAQSNGTVAAQISQAQSMLMEMSSQHERPDVITMAEAMHDVVERFADRQAGTIDPPPGIKTGLDDLDKIIKSMRAGNMVVIAGRPGTGKTVLGLQVADEISVRRGGAALVFTLEMEAAELAKRSLSANSGVAQDTIDGTRAAVDDDYPKLTSSVNALHSADYRLCEKPALPFSRIASIARFQHRVKPLDLIVLDYIGLVTPEPGSRLFNRTAELGAVSRGIKALAKELKIPIVVLAQLNRGIEGRQVKRPQMSDLRDCGDIEQDADIIIFAHRDESSDEGRDGITEIFVEKCRHAKVGQCRLKFRGDIARFVQAPKSYGDTEAPSNFKDGTARFFPK